MALNKSVSFLTSIAIIATLAGCSSQMHKAAQGQESQYKQTLASMAGTYTGILPDNKGNEVMITFRLTKANTFTLTKQYLTSDGSLVSDFKGKASWRDTDHGLVVSNADESGFVFRWEDGKLFPIEVEGEPVTGETALKYSLVNENAIAINITTLEGTEWRLVELNGKAITKAAIPRQRISITFEGAEKKVYGSAGCNSYFGTYELKAENWISCSKIASTRMACSEEQMTIEQAFLKMLELVDNYTINGNQLTLNNATMALSARFEKARD